eukprot:scaffold124517_cov31-Tisochrysis_lutea.AAC.3
MATYNITSVDMDLLGGSCETWTIRTVDNILHPFHIHTFHLASSAFYAGKPFHGVPTSTCYTSPGRSYLARMSPAAEHAC